MKLSIGIVNHESGYRLRQCVESILAHPPSCEHEVVVIDNDSRDGSADVLAKEPMPDNVRVIPNRVNLLFTGGVNLAFTRTTGEYFLNLNPDMVAAPGAFDALVATLDEDPLVGGVAGQTYDNEGRFEVYVRRDPAPFATFVGNFGGRLKNARVVRRVLFELPTIDPAKPAIVPIAAGGCFAFRRATFGDSLPMSRDFGVFWSDGELCQRVRAGGRRIVLAPGARFRHDHKSRDVEGEAPLPLVLDYAVGCATYFRIFGGRLREAELKALFGAGFAASLLTKHLARSLLGRQPWSAWHARARMLRDFLGGRNEILLRSREHAARLGDADALSVL